MVFVNADEIARAIKVPGISQAALDLRAGRETIKRLDALVETKTEFMFETTLTSLSYIQKIPTWKKAGYSIALIYLRLPDVEASIARVRRRVEAGGHDIPEAIIRRRFTKSLDYFENRYKPVVDEWSLWESLEGEFHLTQMWDD